MKIARPPRDAISDAASLPPASSRSASASFAPSCANRIAASRPKPDPAPVTNATFPLSLSIEMPSEMTSLTSRRLADETGVRTAIDCDIRAVDERGALRRQEQNQVSDFLRLAWASHRSHALHDFLDALRSRRSRTLLG